MSPRTLASTATAIWTLKEDHREVVYELDYEVEPGHHDSRREEPDEGGVTVTDWRCTGLTLFTHGRRARGESWPLVGTSAVWRVMAVHLETELRAMLACNRGLEDDLREACERHYRQNNGPDY